MSQAIRCSNVFTHQLLSLFEAIELDSPEGAWLPCESTTRMEIFWPEATLHCQTTERLDVEGSVSMMSPTSPGWVIRMLKGGEPPVMEIWYGVHCWRVCGVATENAFCATAAPARAVKEMRTLAKCMVR